jgi:hypothetical protein
VSSKIEIVLQLLSDGGWHSMYELQQLSELNEPQLKMIVSFLEKYDFARTNFEMKVRANQFFEEFLSQV